MKRIIICLLLAAAATGLKAQNLTDIERNGSWYYFYNENGRKYHTMSVSSVGDIVGWSTTFFVAQKESWIYLYDSKGRRYQTLSASTAGTVISVTGNRFTTRKGSWIYTYNSNGKRISTRPAH